MITVDTSALLSFLAVQDLDHAAVMAVARADPGPRLIPVAALAEMTFMIERDLPAYVEHAFLDDLASGRYRLYWQERDLTRIHQLIRRYADLPLGFSDAAIAVCAERHGGRVLTLDRRHFDVLARGEKTLAVLP